LLEADPYPVGLEHSAQLAAALGALRDWLTANLAAQGFSRSDVQRVHLVFLFRVGGGDYDCAVAAMVVDRHGRAHFSEAGFIAPA
jgi:hypothetical protein